MKNILFGTIAIVLFTFNVNAQEEKEINQKADFKSASLITSYEKEVTEYKFLSLVELNDEADRIIQEFDFDNHGNAKEKTCQLTVEIKVEITIGVTQGSVTGSITTSCINAKSATKQLKAMLLAVAMG